MRLVLGYFTGIKKDFQRSILTFISDIQSSEVERANEPLKRED